MISQSEVKALLRHTNIPDVLRFLKMLGTRCTYLTVDYSFIKVVMHILPLLSAANASIDLNCIKNGDSIALVNSLPHQNYFVLLQ